MHAEERAEGGVDSRQLHRDEAEQLLTAAGAAVALIAQVAELQFLEGRQELERKRVIGPILVDDRLDLGVHVGAYLPDDGDLVSSQDIHKLIEIAVRGGERLRL